MMSVIKLPISEIKLDKSFFPGHPNAEGEYKKLWEKFTSELKFVQSRDFVTFSDNLLFLLEKYATRIPASTQHFLMYRYMTI